MEQTDNENNAAGAPSELNAELAIPKCCGAQIAINISEYCCPIEYGSIAYCEHCGKEAGGNGPHNTRSDAEQGAILAWNTMVAN